MEPVENQNITKKDDPHYKTPLEFAKWRVNELQKPQQAGIVNETIDTVIQIVNGILGQFNRDSGESKVRNQTVFEQFDNDGVMRILSEEYKKLHWMGVDFWSRIRNIGVVCLIFIGFIIAGFFNLIRFFLGIFTSSLIKSDWLVTLIKSDWLVKEFGNVGRVIVPLIIYGTLFIVTLGSESNYNTYRLLALLLLYIISYTELKYLGFMVIFVVSIVLEILWLFFKTNENQNE